jgi:hypothetical protein
MRNEATAAEVLAEALHQVFISPNECDSNLEAANVVDGLFAVARGLRAIAQAIREQGHPAPGKE